MIAIRARGSGTSIHSSSRRCSPPATTIGPRTTANGGFNSRERLDYERQLFFGVPKSLGQQTLAQEVQKPRCASVRMVLPHVSRTGVGRTWASPM